GARAAQSARAAAPAGGRALERALPQLRISAFRDAQEGKASRDRGPFQFGLRLRGAPRRRAQSGKKPARARRRQRAAHQDRQEREEQAQAPRLIDAALLTSRPPTRYSRRNDGGSMAQKPRITLGSPPDPRNRAMIDGLVEVDGYDIEYVSKYSPGEFHY